jgi:hypothetical protein
MQQCNVADRSPQLTAAGQIERCALIRELPASAAGRTVADKSIAPWPGAPLRPGWSGQPERNRVSAKIRS